MERLARKENGPALRGWAVSLVLGQCEDLPRRDSITPSNVSSLNERYSRYGHVAVRRKGTKPCFPQTEQAHPRVCDERKDREANQNQDFLKTGTRTAQQTIRVIVVDDDDDIRFLLKAFLEQTGEFVCVGSFADGNAAVSQTGKLAPDLVFMDIRMPHSNGIECTRQLKEALPEVKIIILTALLDSEFMNDSLRAGADAYLLKPITAAQCVATARFTVGFGREGKARLTCCEREVMRCLAQGLLYKEIAEKLGISYSAVHKHQHKIFIKLQVSNRTEAIREWQKHGGL